MINNQQRFGLNRNEPRNRGLTVLTVRFGFNSQKVRFKQFNVFQKKIQKKFKKKIKIVFKQSFHFHK